MNLLDIYEGREPHQQAIDKLEQRRIEDLEARMDDCARRGDKEGFQKCKAERDSYYKVNEAGIGQDIADKSEKMARATPQTKAGAVASTVKNAAKWLAGKGGPGKEGPTYEGAEDIEDRGEYDQEGDMVKDNLHTIRREAERLEKILSNNENVPEWVQDKLAQVKGMLTASSEYMQTQHERDHEEQSGEEGVTIAEKLKGLPSKKLGSARDLGKSVKKFRAQRGLEETGTADQWSQEGDWKEVPKSKSGKPVDPRGEVTHLSDVARREAALKARGLAKTDDAFRAHLAQKKNPKAVDEAKWDPWTGGDFADTHDMNHLPSDDADSDASKDPNKPSAEQFKAMIQYYGNDMLVKRALMDLYSITHGENISGVNNNVKFAATFERNGKTEVKYLRSKKDAYNHANATGSRVVSIEPIETDLPKDLITLPVMLGLGDHKKKWMLQFPDERIAQKWEFDHKNAAQIQWPNKEVEEGWSDAIVAQRTGRPRTPYSVYIKGKKWKDFENEDHAEAVANKLRAKFKAEGRDPSVITIAATGSVDEGDQIRLGDVQPGTAGYDAWRKSTHKTATPGEKSQPTGKGDYDWTEKQKIMPKVLPEDVNPKFIIAQVTKLLARATQTGNFAPMPELLAPLMKQYGLTLQQIDAMVPGGLRKAAGEYGIAMKEAANPAQQAAIAIAMKKAGKKPKQVDEAGDRVDPILYKALDRMQPGIAGQGQPGDDLFSAARTALATEWGLMALRSEYATATAYTRQLIDLYLAKHGAKQGMAEMDKSQKASGRAADYPLGVKNKDANMVKPADTKKIQQDTLGILQKAFKQAKAGKLKSDGRKWSSGDNYKGPKPGEGAHAAGHGMTDDSMKEEKTRLDPKCWTGKKIGNPKTKMKGGVRVNNCVPAEESYMESVKKQGITDSKLLEAAAKIDLIAKTFK